MEFTNFTNVAAKLVKGNLYGVTTLSKSADYSLTEDEIKPFIGITLSAASKTITLGLETGEIAFVNNDGGTNAFTLKNVSGDTGTSLAAGKLALVVGSATANESKVIVLN